MQLDTIGDGPLDLENGTVDFDDENDIFDELEDDMVEPLQEQLNRTIDMFNRFKKY